MSEADRAKSCYGPFAAYHSHKIKASLGIMRFKYQCPDDLRKIGSYVLSPLTSGPILTVSGFVIAAAAFYRQLLFPPNHDVAWFLIAAGRLIDGGTYAADVYEVNAPLAVLIYCPAALLARLTGLAPWTAFLVFSFGLVGASLVSAYGLLRRLFPEDRRHAAGLILVAAILLLLLPGYAFGQREHYAVILIFPYIITAALDGSGAVRGPRILYIVIYAAAAIGALIKPFFVLFPTAVIVCRVIQERSFRAIWKADTAIFLVFGLGYLFLLIFIYPGWIEIAFDTSALYQSTYVEPGDSLYVGAIGAGVAVFLIVVSQLGWRSYPAGALVCYTAVAALAATAILIMQLKGWVYHQLPIKIFLLFSFAAYFWEAILRQLPYFTVQGRIKWLICLGASAMFLTAFFVKYDFVLDLHYKQNPDSFYSVVEKRYPGKSIILLNARLPEAFPWVLMQGRTWCSRFPSLWLIRSIESALLQEDADVEKDKLRAFRNNVVAMVVADIEKCRPQIMLVDTKDEFDSRPGEFSYHSLFRTHPAFEAVRHMYRPVDKIGRFVVFSLR